MDLGGGFGRISMDLEGFGRIHAAAGAPGERFVREFTCSNGDPGCPVSDSYVNLRALGCPGEGLLPGPAGPELSVALRCCFCIDLIGFGRICMDLEGFGGIQ